MDITVSNPVSVLLDAGMKVIDRIWPDPAQAAAAKLQLFTLQQNGDLQQMVGQMTTNTEEAKSASVFVAGWRPFIGWVCGLACAWNWMGLSIAKFACELAGKTMTLQPASMSEMMPVLMGILGLGAYRTYEKVSGVAPTTHA